MASPVPGGPRRQSGLGNRGLGRIRENLGQPDVAADADQALYGNNPPSARPLTTPWEFPDSSRVRAFQYDYSTQELRVRFIKYDTPWVYEGVPSAIYEAFASAPSKGKFINSTLNYTHHRRATSSESGQYP